MPSIAGSHATDFPGIAHADFVIGDRDGSTASPALSLQLCEWLRGFGYSVDYNHPYKGVELVRRYGAPAANRHSIQVEVNRKLYMDEATLQPHAGFAVLRGHLRDIVQRLIATDPRKLA
jgi:N-formylglutamate deformylase